MGRRRLDAELVRRGLVPSRAAALQEITSNNVLVDGAFADKPSRMVSPAQNLRLKGAGRPFVSRAGQKLAGALDRFELDPSGRFCLDAGSSTGGFTDCLLQRGARYVVAVDVGTNQLHEKIRADQRVAVREQTDVRTLEPAHFSSRFDLITGDLSFISLRLVLPALIPLAAEGAPLVMLIKPQFEAGRQEASKGKGIITDPQIWRRVIGEVIDCAVAEGAGLVDLVPSSVRGGQGNREFVALLDVGRPTLGDRERLCEQAVAEAADQRPAANDEA